MHARRLLLLALVVFSSAALSFQSSPESAAAPIATDPFQRAWARTDQPVASGAVSRTWMWGLEPFTEGLWEDYEDSPGGTRQVQYFDKSRMEITNPNAVDDGVWYVTNGLLVVEMMSGEMQIGNEERAIRAPANINVAGDPDDPLTYAVLGQRRFDAPIPAGWAVTQRIDATGQVTDDPALASRGVTAATHVPETNHTVASVFWEFMHSSGLVQQGDQTVTAPLFESAFYATGYPITEAYWAQVKIGGTPHEVLLQCFERRCLTYAPNNPPGWQVEAGNVGQHYYRWRYPDAPAGPSEQANALAAAVTRATNDEDRYQALLAVMDALHVGVYTGDGQQILAGAERGAIDFYLYDLEVRMMAAALGRGETWGVEDIAMLLTSLPILEDGATVDPELLRQVLIEGAQSARETPGDRLSLVPLIVRQLGLSQPQPFDMFADVPTSGMRFDALSYFLILADILVPIVKESGPGTSDVSQLASQSLGILKVVPLNNPCESDIGTGVAETWGFGKWFLGFIKKIGAPIRLVTVIVDAIHGALLAYSVRVQELDQHLETHYGHEEPGKELRFRIKVEMLDELSDNIIKCGWLLGVEFPKKGGIPRVTMIWLEGFLGNYGEILCGDSCRKTDDNGIATLIFQPKQERDPGKGTLTRTFGSVSGVAMYQSRHRNYLGSVNQLITPKFGSIQWTVEYHEPLGYDIRMEVQYEATAGWINEDGERATYKGSGHAVFNVWIPMETLFYPGWYHNHGVVTLTATGSGSASIDWPYGLEACRATWSGSWSDEGAGHFIFEEPARADAKLVSIYPYVTHPPSGLYSTQGTCPVTGPTTGAYIGIMGAIPWVNLAVEGDQQFTSNDGCPRSPAPEYDFCTSSSRWTVTVTERTNEVP